MGMTDAQYKDLVAADLDVISEVLGLMREGRAEEAEARLERLEKRKQEALER